MKFGKGGRSYSAHPLATGFGHLESQESFGMQGSNP